MVYKWALKRTGPLKTKFAPHLSYMLYYEMIYITNAKPLEMRGKGGAGDLP
jgi:hypothetical protein